MGFWKKVGRGIKEIGTGKTASRIVDNVIGTDLAGDKEKAGKAAQLETEQEKQSMFDDYESSTSGDLLGSYPDRTTNVQENGMPKGQQEAMKYQMEQAQKGVASSYSGGGKGRSGAALKALSDRQQGIASENYQQAFDNNLKTNESNFNQDLAKSQQTVDWKTNLLNARTGSKDNESAIKGKSSGSLLSKII